MSRAIRVETRSRHKDDIKRAMHSVVKVRKWEKKWVRIGDTSMSIFKWMPSKTSAEEQNSAHHHEIMSATTPVLQKVISKQRQSSTTPPPAKRVRIAEPTLVDTRVLPVNPTKDESISMMLEEEGEESCLSEFGDHQPAINGQPSENPEVIADNNKENQATTSGHKPIRSNFSATEAAVEEDFALEARLVTDHIINKVSSEYQQACASHLIAG